ncbi:hypothetical protein DES43_11259 [Aquamicrobium defluvii]|uniref:Uncharacterized protein n=1 Tax=Aquamicrobium defluvii TaxID=69279 RepID=A0A4R6YEZ9_9HYPH|nr:hypothetical protein DES43_11259 [Aquamicrobium defluvii]
MEIWIPLLGRLKMKPAFAVRRAEKELLRIGGYSFTFLGRR